MIRRPIQDQNKKARAGPWGPALAFHYHKSDIGIEECCHAAPVRDAVISPCDYGQTRPGLRPFLGFAHPLRVLCRCSRRLRASTCHAAAAARRDIASPSPGRPSTTCGLPWALPCAPALSPCFARLRASCWSRFACSRRAASLRLGTQTAGLRPSWFVSLAPVHPRCSRRLRASFYRCPGA